MVSTGSEYLWFLDTLVRIRIASGEGADNLSVLEHRVPFGDSPPVHIHHTEDEVFQTLEGEFTFRIDGEDRRVGPGEILLAPKGVPHTYRVDSPSGGRCITITAHGDFERFVRAVGRSAERLELPPPSGPPDADAVAALAAAARTFGIELVGPPLPHDV